MYAQQHLTDEFGEAENALWGWRMQLERIIGARLIDFDDPTRWLRQEDE
jgi:hypothetical protein